MNCHWMCGQYRFHYERPNITCVSCTQYYGPRHDETGFIADVEEYDKPVFFCEEHCFRTYEAEQRYKRYDKMQQDYPKGEICNHCKCEILNQSYHGTNDKLFDKDPCYIPLVCDVKLWFCSYHCREPYVKPTLPAQSMDSLVKLAYKMNKAQLKI